MINTILGIIAGGFARMLLALPGAFVKWCCTGFKKPFREIYYDPEGGDFLLGTFVTAGLLIVIKALFFGVNSLIYRPKSHKTNKSIENNNNRALKIIDSLKKKEDIRRDTAPCPLPILSLSKRSNILTGIQISFFFESQLG